MIQMHSKETLNRWINYKQMFKIMYKVSIYEHYKNDVEAVKILKYEILYL